MVRLLNGPKNAKPLCFCKMSHSTVRPRYVRETGLADKTIWPQVNGPLAKDLIGSITETRARGGQPFILVLEQKNLFGFRDTLRGEQGRR